MAGALRAEGLRQKAEAERILDSLAERLRSLLQLLRDDLNQLLKLLQLCGHDLEQLLKILNLQLLERLHLLKLLRQCL